MFLFGDAVICGKAGQKVPKDFYNIQIMLNKIFRNRGQIGACGTCMDARATASSELTKGLYRSSLDELAQRNPWANKVLVF